MYGFPVFHLTPAQKLQLLEAAPGVEVFRRLQAGTLSFSSAADVEACYAAMPWVSPADAEAARLAWQQARLAAGQDAR